MISADLRSRTAAIEARRAAHEGHSWDAELDAREIWGQNMGSVLLASISRTEGWEIHSIA
jgi:hypothetical protein